MTRLMPMPWQVTLADLSLILFLVTLGGFAARAEQDEAGRAPEPATAPSQALYRTIEGGQTLGQWLVEQPDDPRATLTIILHHPAGDSAWAFAEATRLRSESARSAFPKRIIIEESDKRLVYASLAYDSSQQHPAIPRGAIR